jgi:hypothetical protein
MRADDGLVGCDGRCVDDGSGDDDEKVVPEG